MQTISVKQLADKQRQTDVDLIDVRMPTEYREVHADGASTFRSIRLTLKRLSIPWEQAGVNRST